MCGAGDLSAAFSLRKNGRGVRVHAPLAMVARWRTPCIKSWPQYQVGRCVSSPLFGKALVERTKIDDNSLAGSAASLCAVACRHLEVNSLSLDVDYLGRRAHLGLRAGRRSAVHLSVIPQPLGVVGVIVPWNFR
jgi:hypothetical protein